MTESVSGKYSATAVNVSDEDTIAAFSEVHQAAFAAQNENGWAEKSIKSSLETSGTAGFVFKDGEQTVGALMVRTVCDESELITVAVHPEWQLKGVGKWILSFMVDYLKGQNVATCFLEVRQDNLKAVSLYSKIGFVQVGLRRGYYQNREGKRTDALLYSFDLLNKK
ncbi:ribosomal protein S18-alanine N-acetyltransferase [Kordiimonas laminariae]|uniref:ribosomal protein S18-alanine N-acetyltransferase n=1 Tax=Kordiimonas laminariae TaxID=2917717 RepID=UPI001FF2A710|nr:ribosomal protein S18-alanine N-acetyltransferase [Kordiimonas laminariae]MCK0069316.1 ribosomal protein S18-alanine N-acetyltransferase [Kordiimonas laminariae]